MDVTIEQLSNECSEWLRRCLDRSQDAKVRAGLSNRIADFNLWCDGVGAKAKSRGSLDARFRSRPDDIAMIKGMLTLLRQFLGNYEEVLGKAEESNEALRNVDSALGNLALLAMAIRQTGKRSRLEKADKKYNPDDHLELRDHLEFILRIQGSPAGQKSTCLDWRQQRLIDANLRRRNRFVQAQNHSKHLRSRHDTQTAAAPHQPQSQSRLKENNSMLHLLQLETKSQRILKLQETASRESNNAGENTKSGTSASAPDSKMELGFEQAKRSSSGSEGPRTVITKITASSSYPHMKVPDFQQTFQCPCCCQTLTREHADDENLWRKHLANDISPYTCIANNCPRPFTLFTTTIELEHHLRNDHSQSWQCPLCEEYPPTFKTESSMERHFKIDHKDIDSDDRPGLLSMSLQYGLGIEACPFCGESDTIDSEELIEHVLGHMHNFSLLSLPWARETFDAGIDHSPQFNPSHPNLLLVPKPNKNMKLSIQSEPLRVIDRLTTWLDSEAVKVPRDVVNTEKSREECMQERVYPSPDFFTDQAYFADQSTDASSRIGTGESDGETSQAPSIVSGTSPEQARKLPLTTHEGKDYDPKETFRVQNIPFEFDIPILRASLSRALQLKEKNIQIHSLSLDNFRSSLTATVTFAAKPFFFHGRGRLGDPDGKSVTESYTLELHYNEDILEYVELVHIDQHFRGFTPLCPYNHLQDTAIDCIIVHGFGGHAFRSWMDSSSAFNWTRDKLPNDHPELNVLTYGYDAYFSEESCPGTNEWAEIFRLELRQWRTITNGNLEARPIVFFLHGLGGFIFKEVVITVHENPVEEDLRMVQSIYGALFFGVPIQDTGTHALAAMVQGLPAQSAASLFDRGIRHRLRKGQHERFCTAFPFRDSKIIQFFDGRETKVDENDYRLLVNQQSGSHGRPWETSKEYVRSVDADHETMIKFSPTSEVYDEISFLLQTSFIPEAPHTIRRRLMSLSSEGQDLPSNHVTSQPFAPCGLPPYRGDQIQHREDIITKMVHCLEESGHLLPVFCLYGIGGVGKTQAALKYIHERSHIYKLVLWVNANTAEKLASDFDRIAVELDCKVEEAANPEVNREAVKAWLHNHPDWLLVFDNADDPSHLTLFWPSAIQKGCIIITSRSCEIIDDPVVNGASHVNSFDEEDGAQVLLSRISEDLRDYELAKQISRKLEGIPLAIAHAAAFISESPMTLAGFLEKYDQFGREVVERGDLPIVWNLQFSRLSAVSQSLMEVLSLLHPDNIQLDVLATIMTQEEITHALGELTKNGLVQERNSGDGSTHFLVMHRLVQAAYRENWAPETWQKAFGAACFCINNKFPKQDRGQTIVPLHSECQKYDDHVLSLMNHFIPRQDLLDPSVEFVETLAHSGWYHFERRQFDTARTVLETAERICDQIIQSGKPGERRNLFAQEEEESTLAFVFNNLASLRASLWHESQ